MSLYQLARDGDADELLSRLWESDSVAVRTRAAELLGELADESDHEIVRGVVEAATEDDDEAVRAAAIDALDEMGQAAVERLLAELTGVDADGGAEWVTAKRFAQALSADQPELRMAAANALGRLGDTAVVPALIKRLDDPEARVRVRVATACGSLGDPRAVGPLVELLSDNRRDVKRAAADALANIGTGPALSALRELLDDDSETIRWVVVSALGEAGSVAPVRDLAGALGDESSLVRRAAVFSIIGLLSNAPQNRSHQVREAVVSELSAVDDDVVVGPLVEILEDSVQRPQRRNAAWLLGRVTPEGQAEPVTDALVALLSDDDAMTAQFAATSLTDVGGEYAERRLLDLVTDEDADSAAQAKAVFVLGQIGTDRSRAKLEKLTNESDDQEVRRRAFAALSKLGGHA